MDPPPTYPDLLEHLQSLASETPPDLDVRLIELFTAQLTGSFATSISSEPC
jgi:hypothetical protein